MRSADSRKRARSSSPVEAARKMSSSKIIRNSKRAETIFIGERQRDLRAEAAAEKRLGEIFPMVSIVTDFDGAKMIPVTEITRLEAILKEELEAARKTGYEQGYQAGVEKGLDEARRVARQLEQAINDAVSQRASLLQEAKQKILELVMQISKKVTFDAIEVDREATVGMIEGVINQLVDRSKLKIKVHPSHLPLMEQHLDRFLSGSTAIKDLAFEPDPRVRQGGCFIETPSGDIDARLESQFDVISDTLLDERE
ncbi:hypothetical protein GF377_06845 [candidate division GN15 bacterium]|nr:hypothetical protein [candidate division GN15 bacterium]